jgi:uncharacterized protein (DUF1330 family)
MAKGYWIAHVDVRDPDSYRHYTTAIREPLRAFGARYLVRAGEVVEREGELKPRTVVIEFPSVEAAQACYESAAYRTAMRHRLAAAAADLVVIAGYDGIQPGGG